jgi:hypothetical protein
MINREELEELIGYLEKAASQREGADLRPELAKQLLDALEALANRGKPNDPPIVDGNGGGPKNLDGS